MIKNKTLLEHGHMAVAFPLEEKVANIIKEKKWKELDQYFLEISKPGGQLRKFFNDILDFDVLEHIIAIRSAPDDEDGIWHDDGSRFLGFSLSLNFSPETIEGGKLLFRKKETTDSVVYPVQPYGTIIVFLSGLSGYEHMVSAVTKGERIVIAGWCS